MCTAAHTAVRHTFTLCLPPAHVTHTAMYTTSTVSPHPFATCRTFWTAQIARLTSSQCTLYSWLWDLHFCFYCGRCTQLSCGSMSEVRGFLLLIVDKCAANGCVLLTGGGRIRHPVTAKHALTSRSSTSTFLHTYLHFTHSQRIHLHITHSQHHHHHHHTPCNPSHPCPLYARRPHLRTHYRGTT
jgi:hypothetical protein